MENPELKEMEGYTPEEYRAMLRLFDVKCADTAGNDSSPSERLAVIKWMFTYTEAYEEIHRQFPSFSANRRVTVN
jgi:hypothetical protein